MEVVAVEIDIACKKLYDDSISPTQAYEDDAGWDLYAHHFNGRGCKPDFKIRTYKFGHECICKIYTGVALAIPKGSVGLIFDRSGLGGQGVMRLMGVLDPGFRGELIVKLINLSGGTATVNKGDKVAQLVVLERPTQRMILTDELPPSERGERGFGSSGA